VLQPAVRLGDALVAYSLGDFLGTALPRVPWPLRLGAVLVVEISVDEETKGKIGSYRFVPFVREKASRHERLVTLDAAGVSASQIRERFDAIFPAAETAVS
jgi:poly-gamma-glutamate synthesis protein (capsule biosynthesis protein)